MKNKLWLGYRNINSDMWLILPDDAEKYEKIVDGKKQKHIMACWYTNLDTEKRHEEFVSYKKYSPEEYPRYDNYDAINVDKVAEIPYDYNDIIGVPITFLDKYNPDQFEIIGFWNTGVAGDVIGATKTEVVSGNRTIIWNGPTVNKKTKYFRILIKRKANQ